MCRTYYGFPSKMTANQLFLSKFQGRKGFFKCHRNFSKNIVSIKAIKPLLCIGDAIVIITRVKFAVLTLATVVIFFSLLIKLFFKAKAAKTAL